jgi:hypothetical protein
MSQSDTTPRAVQRCHEILAWMIPLLDQFPRARRFTLGERLEGGLLVILKGSVAARHRTGTQIDSWSIWVEVIRNLRLLSR